MGKKVQLSRISKKFVAAGKPVVKVFDDICITIAAGEFVSVLGPSGSGKTTLLRIIAGLEKPTSGNVLIDGIKTKSRSSEVGMVFQSYTAFPWLTVQKNIEFGIRASKNFDEADLVKADVLMEHVGLDKFKTHFPHELSGGMLQRLALARSLAVEPAILLMDEPFGALDQFTREKMQDLILSLWGKIGTTVVFVTHDIGESVYLADTVYLMSQSPGRIVGKFEIPLERPRKRKMRDSKVYTDLVSNLRHTFENV